MSPSPPRVTAIIIVYNGEAFLEEAIASVVSQQFGNWELLVIDDGSTDQSLETARRFARNDPRIRVLSHPDGCNHGMSATRNLGLANARGEYIGFLDADDLWVPEKLAEQVSILDSEPRVGLIYGRTLIWSSWNGGEDFYYDLGLPANQVYEPPTLFHILLGNRCQTPTTCNALMRAELVRRIGGFGDAFRGMFEDQVFFSKALLCAPAYVANQTWARYRQHPASCSAQSALAGQDAVARNVFLRWLNGYASEERVGILTRLRIWREIVRGARLLLVSRIRMSLAQASK
jgi:glycosyltransferase involved in cell wall biosynthesis